MVLSNFSHGQRGVCAMFVDFSCVARQSPFIKMYTHTHTCAIVRARTMLRLLLSLPVCPRDWAGINVKLRTRVGQDAPCKRTGRRYSNQQPSAKLFTCCAFRSTFAAGIFNLSYYFNCNNALPARGPFSFLIDMSMHRLAVCLNEPKSQTNILWHTCA